MTCFRRRPSPEQVEAASIRRLRRELVWWGVDTSELSDEELVAGVARAAERLRSCGISGAEACENLAAMASVLSNSP